MSVHGVVNMCVVVFLSRKNQREAMIGRGVKGRRQPKKAMCECSGDVCVCAHTIGKL